MSRVKSTCASSATKLSPPAHPVKLPRPAEQLAGCCWLPRFAHKTRCFVRGELPLLYRAAFGSRVGVDGYFLRHFGLSRRQFLHAVAKARDDEALAAWFLALPTVSAAAIASWNRLAPTLGAKGSPGYLTFQVVRWIFYPRTLRHPVGTIFAAIEQDEAAGAVLP